MNVYFADLTECQDLADQIESKIAVGSAVVGALFGAIIPRRVNWEP